MHTIYIIFYLSSSLRTSYITYHKNHLFWAKFFRVNTLKTKTISQKEKGMCVSEWTGLYGLRWSCMETSGTESSKPICQCIWLQMRQASYLQQHQHEKKKRILRKVNYLFNTVLVTKAQGMLWSPKWRTARWAIINRAISQVGIPRSKWKWLINTKMRLQTCVFERNAPLIKRKALVLLYPAQEAHTKKLTAL